MNTTLLSNEHFDTVDLVEELKKILIGHKIIEVRENGYLETLFITDNGYQLSVMTNEGCGGCGNGWSDFEAGQSLVDCENGIVDIQVACKENDYDCERYEVSVLRVDGRLTTFETDDGYGNGYYGGGFMFSVSKIETV